MVLLGVETEWRDSQGAWLHQSVGFDSLSIN